MSPRISANSTLNSRLTSRRSSFVAKLLVVDGRDRLHQHIGETFVHERLKMGPQIESVLFRTGLLLGLFRHPSHPFEPDGRAGS